MSTEDRPERQKEQGVNAENPWPGLASFTELDREFFHGRDDEKDDLYRRVARQSLTVLFGQSGLGKSSLLRAGLFPKLREAGYLPIPIRLDHSPSQVSLAAQVILAADRAIASAGGKVQDSSPDTMDSLWKYFHRRNFVPTDTNGASLRLVLVLDQFEELFAAGQANETARRRASDFINQFADLIENRVPLVLEEQMESQPELARLYDMQEQDHRYLICMREDYLPQLESLKRVIPSLSENRMRLTRMNGVNALEAVLKPGRHLLTESVATRIVRFVSGGKVRQLDGSILQEDDMLAGLEIEPSLLSLVCRELNSQRQATGLSQITGDLLAGNQKRILLDFYERCVTDMPVVLREFIEDQLVTESGLRENIALERIQSYLKEHDVAPASIDELISRRLLQVEERLDVRRIELTHDVLTSVVKQSRDERRVREAALKAEQEAAQLLAKARQQRRRLSLIVGGMAVVLAIVSVFGFSSYRLYRISQDRLVEVEEQKLRAEEGRKSAAQAKLKAEAVKEVFDEATLPVTVENAAHIPGLGPVQEELAQLRIKSLERLAAKTPDDESIPIELAEAFAVSGVIRSYVGSFKAAESDLRKSIELYRQLHQKKPQQYELKLAELQATNELAYLYKEDNRMPAARKVLLPLIRELEDELGRFPNNEAFQFELLLALSRLSGAYALHPPAAEKNKNLDRMTALLNTLEQKKYRIGELARLRAVVSYFRGYFDYDTSTFEQRLSNVDKLKELDEKALFYFPRSPMIRAYRNSTLNDRADLLIAQGLYTEGINDRELAMAEARAIYNSSPNVYRYGLRLNHTLMDLADDYNRLGRDSEAEKLIEESTKLTTELRQRFSDRGDTAAEWINQRKRYAYWLDIARRQGDRVNNKKRYDDFVTLALGPSREFANKHPDHYKTQVEFAVLLGMAGSLHNDRNEEKEAYRLYHEAVEVLVNRCFSDNEQEIQPQEIQNFFEYAASAAEAALAFKGDEELTALLNTVEQLQIPVANPAASYNYARTLLAIAKSKKEQRDFAEVVRWTKKNCELQSKALQEYPWHWYLRTNLGSSYQLLGDVSIELKQPQQAIEAYQEFAKLILVPLHGIDIAEFLDETQPATLEHAVTLQEKLQKLLDGSMKRFTITANSNGVNYPIHIYITNVPPPKHPLEDQAMWLKEERNAKISEDVMESFKRLQSIAAENKVSFVDLCVYALGDSQSQETTVVAPLDEETSFDDGSQTELGKSLEEFVGISQDEIEAPKRNLFSEDFSQILDLQASLKENPDNSIVGTLLLARVDDVGNKLLKAELWQDAAELLEYACSLHRLELEKSHDNALKMRNFARSLRNLAAAYFNTKDFRAAFLALQRQHELLRQVQKLTSDKPLLARAQLEKELAECALILGETAEMIQSSTEAMNWYLQAAELKHPRAYRKISRLLRQNTSLSTKLAEPEQDLFAELYEAIPSIVKEDIAGYSENLTRWRRDELLQEGPRQTSSFAEAEKDWNASLSSYAQEKIQIFTTELERRMIELRDDPQVRSRREALIRGRKKYLNDDYAGALADFVEGCQEDDTSTDDLNRLGIILGRNGKWEASIEAYQRAIKKHEYSALEVAPVLNLFEAFICNDQPEKLLEYNEVLAANGFSIPAYDHKDLAIYHAFIAMAQIQTGADAKASLDKSRESREMSEPWVSTWDWTEFDRWLNESDLEEEKKKRIRAIVDEIRPTETES